MHEKCMGDEEASVGGWLGSVSDASWIERMGR